MGARGGIGHTLAAEAQVEKVGEPFIASSPIFVFEMKAYPEAKILDPAELVQLHERLGGWYRVAEEVGSGEAFVRQSCRKPPLKRR